MSFGTFDSFCICISVPRDYYESKIARAKRFKHQKAFCVWAEHMERKCYMQPGGSFEDVAIILIQ